jgi:hypothetical protein
MILVQSSRFKVQGSKFKVQSSRFKVQGSKFKVQGSKFKVQGCSAFWVPSFCLTAQDPLLEEQRSTGEQFKN